MGRQPTKSQFSVPRLEPALERGLKPVLSLGTAQALDKDVRISTEVLGRGKCGRVDSVLHNDVPRADVVYVRAISAWPARLGSIASRPAGLRSASGGQG